MEFIVRKNAMIATNGPSILSSVRHFVVRASIIFFVLDLLICVVKMRK